MDLTINSLTQQKRYNGSDERTEEAAYIRHMVEQENIENSQEDDSDDEYERQYDN